MNTQEIQHSYIRQVNEVNTLSAAVKEEIEKSLGVLFSESRVTPKSRPQWRAVVANKTVDLRLYDNGTVLIYYSKIKIPIRDVEDSESLNTFDLKQDDGYRRLITDIKANLFSK
jgi:hypothetical protein